MGRQAHQFRVLSVVTGMGGCFFFTDRGTARIPMRAGRERLCERFDLFRRIEGEQRLIWLTSTVGVLGRIRRQRVRARPHAVVEDRADQLPCLVQRPGSGAGSSDGPKELLDLAGRDLANWTIAEGGHDQTGGGATTPALCLAGLCEQATMIPERRGLGAPDLVEPEQVLRRQLPKAHAAPAPLLGVALEQGLFGVVFANQSEHPLGRLGLCEGAIG